MPSSTAYLDGLKMLARRELSEQQVRQRLVRRNHDGDAIDEAVNRLKQERAIDDARTAGAIARTETSIKRRGRFRIQRKIESAGIPSATAKHAVDEVFSAIDPAALIEAALEKRLRGRTRIKDEAEFSRLYRYLIGQGFEADQVMKALGARRVARFD